MIKKSQQNGMAIIASLVVLSALTLLGLSTLRSTETQQAILKNTQLLKVARNLSTTELNAQIAAINGNAPGARDEIIIRTLDSGVDNIFDISANADTTLNIEFQSTTQGFTRNITTVLTAEPEDALITRNSLGKFEMVKIEFTSAVSLDNSSAQSTQIQGINYYKPK